MPYPGVSVLLPVLDEIEHIEDVLRELLQQDYPGQIEIVVADGGSRDGTREWLEEKVSRERRVVLVENERRRQSHGLNLAAAHAANPILIRADGHTRYAPDYVSRSVAALEELGGAVGSRMNPVGSGRVGRAVAAAMNSPLTMGPARFHHAIDRQEADTAYLGAFRREDFDSVGGFRAFPSGSSEDADFYYRLRRAGVRVFIDPAIVSTYSPRESFGSLWRQYWRYGQGKTEMLWANRVFPSWRPLAPMVLVAAFLVGAALGLVAGVWWPVLGVVIAWPALLGYVALAADASTHLVVLAAGIMHLAYGLGAWYGMFRGPPRFR